MFVDSLDEMVAAMPLRGNEYPSLASFDESSNQWVEIQAEGTLPRMALPQLAYDPGLDRIVVLGSDYNASSQDQIWEMNPSERVWTKVEPSGEVPPTRTGESIALDSRHHKILVFGGLNGELGLLDDLWVFDISTETWTELNPQGSRPPARRWASTVFDAQNDRFILFGGQASPGMPTPEPSGDQIELMGDMWVFDLNTETWQELQPETGPSARSASAMAYDPESGEIILVGGVGVDGILTDTWMYRFE